EAFAGEPFVRSPHKSVNQRQDGNPAHEYDHHDNTYAFKGTSLPFSELLRRDLSSRHRRTPLVREQVEADKQGARNDGQPGYDEPVATLIHPPDIVHSVNVGPSAESAFNANGRVHFERGQSADAADGKEYKADQLQAGKPG